MWIQKKKKTKNNTKNLKEKSDKILKYQNQRKVLEKFHRKFQAKVGEHVDGNYKHGIHGDQMLQRYPKIVPERW